MKLKVFDFLSPQKKYDILAAGSLGNLFLIRGREKMTEIPMPGGGPAYTTPGARPTGILFVIIIQFLLGLLFIVFGTLFVGSSYYFEFTLGGAGAVFTGVLFLFDCYGLWNMQSWTWLLTIFANILHIGVYVFFAIATGMPLIFGIGQMIVSVMIIIYFVLPTTRLHFGV